MQGTTARLGIWGRLQSRGRLEIWGRLQRKERLRIGTTLVAGLLACAGPRAHPVSPADVSGPLVWGGVDHVMRLHRLYFSGQPDRAALAAARDAGVSVVVNLRAPEEMEFDEATAVEEAGMSYVSIPVPKEGPFPAPAFERLEALLRERPSDGIWVHCSSGNRAAGWLATHLVTEHRMSVEEALAVGRRAGITKEPIEEKVRSFVGE